MPINRVVPDPKRVITSDPQKIAQEIERSAEIVSRFWAEELHAQLTAPPSSGGTPVKSGYAKASWILSVGAPTTLTGGFRDNPNYGPQEAGLERVTTYRLDQGAIFMTNNAAHIVRLNAGYSPQASAGFVDKCFARAHNVVVNTFTEL